MIEKENEIWKNIPGYEGYYQASNLGRVRSLDRNIVYVDGERRFIKGRIIIGSAQKGYKITTLKRRGCGRSFKFSQLVAMAFLNHKPDGSKIVVDHIDGDISDDRLSNLRVVTHRENLSSCFRVDKDTLSSKYVGVSWNTKHRRWVSQICYKGDSFFLGLFTNQLEASQVYQSALSKIKDGSFDPNYYKPKFTSEYKGVSFHKASNKWVAQITINGKRKHIGLFKTELEAHNAYQKALKQKLKTKYYGGKSIIL